MQAASRCAAWALLLAAACASGWLTTQLAAQRPPSAITGAPTLPAIVLAEPVVNNPALDTDEHDTQSESTLVLGAGSTVIAAFNNTRLRNNHSVGVSRSTDGGASWTDGGALPNSATGDSADPVLARDEVTGTVYLSALPFTDPPDGVQVFRSTDNGATWSAPVNGAPGFAAGDVFDKPWMTVDNAPGPGQGTVYLVFTHYAGTSPLPRPNGLYLTKSTDGGLTWGPSGGILLAGGAPEDAGLGGWVMTDAQTHALYVLWYDRATSPTRIRMVKSVDFGATFGSAVTVATLAGLRIGGGDLGLIGDLLSNSFPQAVVNNANRDLYAVYNDETSTKEIRTLHAFAGGAGGVAPSSRLIEVTEERESRPPVRVFYGTTSLGGASSSGTAFRMTAQGSVTVLQSFPSTGWGPHGLVRASDGNFYGITQGGGIDCVPPGFTCGTLFRMTPDGTVTTLHAFAGGLDGIVHFSTSHLIQGTDGNLYGTTYSGGTGLPGAPLCCGTVFRMTLGGAVTILHRFTWSDGAGPLGLVQGSDGNLYGVTQAGGTGPGTCCYGTVFKITPGGALTTLHTFDLSFPYPNGALIQAADGYFYGTISGSVYTSGSIFKMSPAGAVTHLHYFSGGAGGANPGEALVQAMDGNFYGVTKGGGAHNLGTVFRMTPAGAVTILHSFTGGADGGRPAALMQSAVDGNFYGAVGDGPNGTFDGSIYRMSTDSDIFFTLSADGGSTWSAPLVLNDDLVTREQFMPTIAVTPNGAHVFAAWYDRRSDPQNSLIERWGVIGSVSGGLITWGPNFRISSGSFPVAIDQDSFISSRYMGDYDQAVADNTAFYTTWSDNRLSSVLHAHQPDVRFAKIAVPVPCPPITLAPASLANGRVSTLYSQTITQSGGSGTPTFAVTSGSLPPGLSLSSAGALGGTPIAAGTFTFTVTATDANGCTANLAYSLTVTPVTACSAAPLVRASPSIATSAPFTDDPLVPGVTPIKAVHIAELRTRVNAARQRVGLTPMPWVLDPVIIADVTVITAQHLRELRTALTEAFQAACLTPPLLTDSTIDPGQTRVLAVHISELRSAVLVLEAL